MIQAFAGVPAWIFLVCVPIAVLFQVIETRGRAEMSMGVGISSFVVILLVGLAFNDIVPLLILEGFVVAMVMGFSLALSASMTAEYSNVSRKGLMHDDGHRLDSRRDRVHTHHPVPGRPVRHRHQRASRPVQRHVAGDGQLCSQPDTVAFDQHPSVLAGIVVALVLYRYKISAVSVALGLILPVSLTAALLVGGIIAWYVAKKGYLKNDNGITASGLIAGDIVVGLAMSLRALL